MKKNIYIISLIFCLIFIFGSCDDYLDTSSPSEVDVNFVFSHPATARAALKKAYETWRNGGSVHSNGLFYDLVVCGSDAEKHPEGYDAQVRHIPENLYGDGFDISTYNIDMYKDAWNKLYSIVAISNTLINSFESSEEFDTYMNKDYPNSMSQLYGEAVALRATVYLELTRFWGDVPFQLIPGKSADGLTSRDYIWEYNIDKLKYVESRMYRVGESSDAVRTNMTRTYVQGLIGRYCLYAAGYATRREDSAVVYKDISGKAISFEQPYLGESNGAMYCRRTDYKRFLDTAKIYLKACVDNPGVVKLQTVDPRSAGDEGQFFGNPYQYVFQQMNDLEVADEDIYEIAETRGQKTERPYAFGRPSSGSSKCYFPCKSYGQSRFHPVYYYADFSPKDMRRDVTCTITGSTGGGFEKIIPLTPGSKSEGGGIANNKWDENRQKNPYVLQKRLSGINCPYMRFSDVILMLAEVYAELGDNVNAKSQLAKVHNRAFKTDADADLDKFIEKCGSMTAAVLAERKLEFGGEGIRRYDMIRTGTLGSAIHDLKERTGKMIAGLENDGYYTFDNGNQISKYIWVKKVDAKAELGYRLTTQCEDVNDPVLFPGWRGQNDNWAAVAEEEGCATKNLKYTGTDSTNIAIKGLFKRIDPADTATLKNEGYQKQSWGIDIVNYKSDYLDKVFCGYEDGKAPIYLVPIDAVTISTSNGKITNGYGFANE